MKAAQKWVQPLQYAACRAIPTFYFQTNSFPFGKFLEAIYLHVLLSKGKEWIMNDLSIVLPLLVEARASAGARRVRGARSARPHTRPAADRPSSPSFCVQRQNSVGFYDGRFPGGQQCASELWEDESSSSAGSRQHHPGGRHLLPMIPLCRKSPPALWPISISWTQILLKAAAGMWICKQKAGCRGNRCRDPGSGSRGKSQTLHHSRSPLLAAAVLGAGSAAGGSRGHRVRSVLTSAEATNLFWWREDGKLKTSHLKCKNPPKDATIYKKNVNKKFYRIKEFKIWSESTRCVIIWGKLVQNFIKNLLEAHFDKSITRF